LVGQGHTRRGKRQVESVALKAFGQPGHECLHRTRSGLVALKYSELERAEKEA
jgi:hypothetical protein